MTAPSDIADVALDFAREVLGWEDAVRFQDATVWENRHLCSSLNPKNFKYTDLNAVMAAVREWCDRHHLVCELCYAGSFVAVVVQNGGEIDECVIASTAAYESATDALMAACVEASRKLRDV